MQAPGTNMTKGITRPNSEATMTPKLLKAARHAPSTPRRTAPRRARAAFPPCAGHGGLPGSPVSHPPTHRGTALALPPRGPRGVRRTPRAPAPPPAAAGGRTGGWRSGAAGEPQGEQGRQRGLVAHPPAASQHSPPTPAKAHTLLFSYCFHRKPSPSTEPLAPAAVARPR